jgi:hypothetical protein
VTDQTTGWGRTFLGFLEIEAAGSCIILRSKCSEAGVTGFRETAVTQRLLASGALTFKLAPEGESRILGPADTNGWIVDPSDPTPAHLALNASDDRRYDADFPGHPLSLVRAFLDRAHSSMSIDLEAVSAHRKRATKRWWKIW